MKVPSIPSSLTKQTSTHEFKKQEVIASSTHKNYDDTTSDGDLEALIASLNGTVVDGCVNPVMCAKIQANSRTRCQVCLLGFHDEMQCFLRGENFQPEALR